MVQGGDIVQTIMIADESRESSALLAELCTSAGYKVNIGTTVTGLLNGVLKKTASVLLLGSSFDELSAQDLIPLLKRCCNNLAIIVVSNELSPPAVLKLRKAGIFYHLLKPIFPEDREELMQAVACALRRPTNCYS